MTLRKAKRVVWVCGLPERARLEAFSDRELLPGNAWSWVVAHLPPPPHIDLHLVCPDRRAKESVSRPWLGATVHLVKVPRGGSYLMYQAWVPALKRKIQELAPDVVHGWGTEGGNARATLAAAPKRHVVGIQGILAVTWPVMKKTPEMLCNVLNERWVLRKARQCVAESEYSVRTASRFTSARIARVAHPLRGEFLAASPGPRNENIMVYLGVLARRKGFFDAVGAFLSRESDWRLVCIGTAATAREHREVERFLSDRKAGQRVVLTGAQSAEQILEWFRRSPLFLLPSYTDTGPTALKEALSMGLWPVCYDNTGPKELTDRYGVGTRVLTGDKKALAVALWKTVSDRLWDNHAEMESCISAIRGHLSPAAVWHALDKIYDCVTGQA